MITNINGDCTTVLVVVVVVPKDPIRRMQRPAGPTDPFRYSTTPLDPLTAYSRDRYPCLWHHSTPCHAMGNRRRVFLAAHRGFSLVLKVRYLGPFPSLNLMDLRCHDVSYPLSSQIGHIHPGLVFSRPECFFRCSYAVQGMQHFAAVTLALAIRSAPHPGAAHHYYLHKSAEQPIVQS